MFLSLFFFFCSVQRDALLCATDTGSLVCKNSRTKNIRAIPVRSERRNRGFVASLWHLCGIFSSMLRNVSPFGHHLKPRLTKSFSWLRIPTSQDSLFYLSFRIPLRYYKPIKFHFDVDLKNKKTPDITLRIHIRIYRPIIYRFKQKIFKQTTP